MINTELIPNANKKIIAKSVNKMDTKQFVVINQKEVHGLIRKGKEIGVHGDLNYFDF
jgi:hypothetical protein